jgi:hypothetical protein
MAGGSITNNVVDSSSSGAFPGGGGVYVYSGSFNLDAGNISGNQVKASDPTSCSALGGGVYVGNPDGSFTMESGTYVSNNKALSNDQAAGGGVSVYGEFIMNGGWVQNNLVGTEGIFSALNAEGGGVFALSSSMFTGNGGFITANMAYGSGSAKGGGFSTYTGTFSGSTSVVDNFLDGGGAVPGKENCNP